MDMYAIAASRLKVIDEFTVPNAAQYKSVRYREQEMSGPYFRMLVRGRYDEELIYEDSNIISAMCGCLYCDDRKMTIAEFVKSYTERGDSVLDNISGYFSIVIIQKNPLKIVLITDPLGLIPCFYYSSADRIVLSTKLDFVRRNARPTEVPIDFFAVLQQVYFNYTLGDKTYFKNVYMQNAGSILEFASTDGNIVKKEKIYWHLSDIVGKLNYSLHDALEQYNYRFVESVNAAVESAIKPALALTAGYDSRTNLAVLRRHLKTIHCFSYGLRNSSDVKIPLFMKDVLRMDYTPLYLDGDFEDRFDGFAENAILHSDGLGDVEKANNEYVYGALGQQYSDIIVGLFGSELLKAHSFPNRLVPDSIQGFFHSSKISFCQAFANCFDSDLLRDFAGYVSGYLEGNYISNHRHLTNRQKLYLFYYCEGVRKYYMKELRIGRYYANVFTPYVARQLLEIVFGSKLSSIYFEGSRLSQTVKKLRSHYVYSHVINMNMPQLLDIATNKGYKPKYDLSLFNELLLLPQYVLHRLKKHKPEYLYNDWARAFSTRSTAILDDGVLLEPLFGRNKQGYSNLRSGEMHRLLSLAVYLDKL